MNHNISPMESLLQYLDTCQNLRKAIRQSEELLNAIEQPTFSDTKLIPICHQMLQPLLQNKERHIAIRAEMMILLYLFAPSQLIVRKSRRTQLISHIATIMNLNRNNAYVYKSTLVDNYRLYRDFRLLVNEGVELLIRVNFDDYLSKD